MIPDVGRTSDDFVSHLLNSADPGYAERILTNLKIPYTVLNIEEYLISKDKDFGPFAIVGFEEGWDVKLKKTKVQLDTVEVILGHFVAWHRADSKNLTKGYLLDLLEFDKPVPNVDLLNWEQGKPSFTYLKQSRIIFIKE